MFNLYTRMLTLIVAITILTNPVSAQQSADDDLLLLIPAIVTSSTSNTGFPPSTTTLPSASTKNLCQGYRVNDLANRPMQAMTKPAPGASYIDPVFGSKITRISNADAIPSKIIKTMYNTIQAWNSDESLLILYHGSSGHHLYDGRTYAYIEQLQIGPADLEQVFWSATDPDIFYYPNRAQGQTVKTATGNVRLEGEELIEYSVSQKTYKVLKRFKSFCAAEGPITAGNDVQMIAQNSNVFGLRCGQLGLLYDHAKNTTATTRLTGYTAPQPFPSGQLVFQARQVLDTNLNVLREFDVGNDEHASLGRSHDGKDTFFAVSFDANQRNSCGNGVGSLTIHDAATGTCRVVVGPATGYPYTLSGSHPSATAQFNPGWAVVSSIGYGTEGDSLLEQELYLANTDPANQQVCRIAHHRATGRRGSVGYFAEPHPVLSPTGTRVLFSSDWNNSGTVDTYVLETPSY